MISRILILLSLVASTGLAQDCLEYQDYLRLVGGSCSSGAAYDVAIAGDFAYLVTQSSELLTFDISDPAAPAQLSSTPLSGHGRAVDIEAGFAFVAESDFGMEVFDLSSPASPVLVGTYELPTGWDMRDVDVKTGVAYASVQQEGLHIIDVGDPQNPAILAVAPLPLCEAQGVFVAEQLAYIAGGYEVGYGVWEAYLDIIDISVPASPMHLGRHVTQGFGRAVVAAGDYAYFSVDDPLGDLVYLRTVNVSDPGNPAATSTLDLDHAAFSMVHSQSKLHAAAHYDGLLVFDLIDPASPAVHSSLTVPGESMGVALSGGLAYLASSFGGLQVAENLDAGNPPHQGSADFEGYVERLDVEDGIACVAAGNGFGLQVLDVLDPADPQYLGGLPLSGPAEDVAIWNDYAIVADGDIQIVNISSPALPVLDASLTTPGHATGLALQPPLIFVADRGAGVCIIDGSGQTIIGSEGSAGYANDLEVNGDLLFVADEYAGLLVLDVGDPSAPLLLGSYSLPSGCKGRAVASSGDLVYLGVKSGSSAHPSGLYILDVSIPSSPALLATVDSPDENSLLELDLALDGDQVYLAHGDVQVIDASDPDYPVTLGYSVMDGSCTGIDTWNGSFHAVTQPGWGDGILTVGLMQCVDATGADQNPAAGSLRLAAYPNPFNPETNASFVLNEDGPVSLRVYDASGRELACLVDAYLSAGVHRFAWNGRDEAGRRLSSGVYFFRLNAGGQVRGEKAVMVK